MIRNFRGKRVDNSEWMFGDRICANGRIYIFDKSKGGFVDDDENAAYNLCQVLPESVGQSTGETDSHGKTIYGGDICLTKECNMKFLVKWTYAGFNIEDGETLEVIGNVTDNPNLLE